MDRLRRLEVFVRVAELSSFSAAGRDLHLAQSQVSRAVHELERQVGSSLFTRNSRSVLLTGEGHEYLAGVRRALRELSEVDEAVRSRREEVKGTLRVTAPVAFGDTLAPVLAGLVARHPGLDVESVLLDRTMDIVQEGFDVAVRFGTLKASALRARRLGSVFSVLVASPSYLAARSAPRRVSDLTKHEHVLFTAKPAADTLSLVDAQNRSTTVRVTGRLRTNELRVAQLAAVAGAGIVALPLPIARSAIDAGALVRVLEGCSLRPTHIYALFPPRSPQPARVTAFVEGMSNAMIQQRSAPKGVARAKS